MKLRCFALSLALLLACVPALAAGQRTFFAMDTVMTVSADGADRKMLDACEAEVQRLEGMMSVTNPSSEIARLNEQGRAELSDEAALVLGCGLDVAAITGTLDVTLYPVVRAWGFTTGDYRVPGDDEIRALLSEVDWRRVSLEGNTASIPGGFMVDLGALAKGYTSDRLAAILRNGGVESALIDLGGNIYALGEKPDGSAWRIGIRDPEDGAEYVGAVAVRDCAVVTSGSYERNFTGPDGRVYGHIFDPATGRPAESGLLSATIVGPCGLHCDAFSTALYVMGPEKAAALLPGLKGDSGYDIQAVLVDENHELWISEGLRDSFTPHGRYKKAKIHWMDD